MIQAVPFLSPRSLNHLNLSKRSRELTIPKRAPAELPGGRASASLRFEAKKMSGKFEWNLHLHWRMGIPGIISRWRINPPDPFQPWKRRHLERFPFQPHELGTKTPTMVTITIYKSWEWSESSTKSLRLENGDDIPAKSMQRRFNCFEIRVCFINNSRVFDCSAALMIGDRLPGIYVWRMAQHFFSLQVIFLSFLLLPDPDTFAGYLFWGRVVFCGSLGVEPNRVLSNLFADFRNATVTIFDELPKNNVAPSRTPGPRRKLILKKNSVSGVHWLLVYQNYMDVSKNSGIPSGWFIIYNGKPYQNGWFGGTPILETPISLQIQLASVRRGREPEYFMLKGVDSSSKVWQYDWMTSV